MPDDVVNDAGRNDAALLLTHHAQRVLLKELQPCFIPLAAIYPWLFHPVSLVSEPAGAGALESLEHCVDLLPVLQPVAEERQSRIVEQAHVAITDGHRLAVMHIRSEEHTSEL